jgi:aryl-alcohol dehydrogenase-like predicted oxidoreductase
LKEIELKNTGITTTALGFGCAGLMRLSTARGRQAILQEAFDQGIRHFDVARMYGLGRSEGELGRFIHGRRSEVVVTTKFGIDVQPVSRAKASVHTLARVAIKWFPRLRRSAVKRAAGQHLPRNYDVAHARASLETSLRELGTDYLDLFLLHEPVIGCIRSEDICAFLEDAKQKGLIRGFGIAGYPQQIRPVCKALPALNGIMQLPNDIIGRQLDNFRDFDSAFITFGPYADALGAISGHLSSDPAIARDWSDAVGMDLSNPGNICRLLLAFCLRENQQGVVLFFSARRQGVSDAAGVCRDGIEVSSISAFEQLALRDLPKRERPVHAE